MLFRQRRDIASAEIQTKINTLRFSRSASCTTLRLATLALNAHLNVSRILKMIGTFSDSTLDISLTSALVVKR